VYETCLDFNERFIFGSYSAGYFSPLFCQGHKFLRALVLTSSVYLLLILVTGLQRDIFFLILPPAVLYVVFLLPPARNSFPAKARPASRSVLPFRPTASSLISLPASRSRRLVNLGDFPLASCVDSRSGSLLELFCRFVYFSVEQVVPGRIPCCCQV
jgi:hypothetical protein